LRAKCLLGPSLTDFSGQANGRTIVLPYNDVCLSSYLWFCAGYVLAGSGRFEATASYPPHHLGLAFELKDCVLAHEGGPRSGRPGSKRPAHWQEVVTALGPRDISGGPGTGFARICWACQAVYHEGISKTGRPSEATLHARKGTGRGRCVREALVLGSESCATKPGGGKPTRGQKGSSGCVAGTASDCILYFRDSRNVYHQGGWAWDN